MKFGNLHYALLYAATARASLPHDDVPVDTGKAQVFDRDVTPQNDPVRFSVLSVLHTAIPSDALSALAASSTGFIDANPPDWYNNLPGDVKSLLPVLYPKKEAATTTSICTPTTSTTTVWVDITVTATAGPAAPATNAPSPVAEASSAPVVTPAAVAPSSVADETGSGIPTATGGSETCTSEAAPYANSTIAAPPESSVNATSTANSTGPSIPEFTANGQGTVGANVLSVVVVAAISAWFCLTH